MAIIQALVAFIGRSFGKILSALGFDHNLYPAWTGKVGA